jgi:FdhD protein
VTVPRSVTPVRAIKVRPDRHAEMPEHLATEEPMEIRVGGPGQAAQALAVTMRTPGHDFELAAGFVVTEGVADRECITSVAYCEALALIDGTYSDDVRYNTVSVGLTFAWEPIANRLFTASSSCGVCGKASIDDIVVNCAPVPSSQRIPASLIPLLPDRLRATQHVFDRTGGLHAAGLFGPDGELWCAREDIGRHNAVDKVVGHTVIGTARTGAAGARADGTGAAGAGRVATATMLASSVLMVSGRVGFEIVQKAAVAGIGTIAAVSAPSSLAVRAADRLGVTLVGFVRGTSFNVYSHPERIVLPD